VSNYLYSSSHLFALLLRSVANIGFSRQTVSLCKQKSVRKFRRLSHAAANTRATPLRYLQMYANMATPPAIARSTRTKPTIFWFPETSVRFDDMHTIQFRGKNNRLGSHEETWTVASLCMPKKSETLTTRRSARSDFFGWRTDAPCGTRAVTSRDLPYGRCQPDSASFNCKQPKGECCIEAY